MSRRFEIWMKELVLCHSSIVSCCFNEPDMVIQPSFEDISLQEDLTICNLRGTVDSCDSGKKLARSDIHDNNLERKPGLAGNEVVSSSYYYDCTIALQFLEKVHQHSSRENQLPNSREQDGFDDLN